MKRIARHSPRRREGDVGAEYDEVCAQLPEDIIANDRVASEEELYSEHSDDSNAESLDPFSINGFEGLNKRIHPTNAVLVNSNNSSQGSPLHNLLSTKKSWASFVMPSKKSMVESGLSMKLRAPLKILEISETDEDEKTMTFVELLRYVEGREHDPRTAQMEKIPRLRGRDLCRVTKRDPTNRNPQFVVRQHAAILTLRGDMRAIVQCNRVIFIVDETMGATTCDEEIAGLKLAMNGIPKSYNIIAILWLIVDMIS